MKAKKLLIPAMLVALSISSAACGKDTSSKESSVVSSDEQGNQKGSDEDNNDNKESKDSPASVSSKSGGGYKVISDEVEPKNFKIEILNRNDIRCDTVNPHTMGGLLILSGATATADQYEEFKKEFPRLDITFKFENVEEWKDDFDYDNYPVIILKRKDEDYTPTLSDLLHEGVIVEHVDESGTVETPLLTDDFYFQFQAYFDAHGAGEYELLVYTYNSEDDDLYYQLHSVVPFTVTDVNQ